MTTDAQKLISPPATVNHVRRFFELSLQMADASEALLEEYDAYSQEFLKGLKKSLAEAKTGKTRPIESLAQLRRR